MATMARMVMAGLLTLVRKETIDSTKYSKYAVQISTVAQFTIYNIFAKYIVH